MCDFQGNAGINGRSGLPGRKGEQVWLIFEEKSHCLVCWMSLCALLRVVIIRHTLFVF